MDDVHCAKLRKKNNNGKPKGHTKINKLALLLQLRPWMPEKYRICYNCLRFKLKKTPGWSPNMEVVENGLANQKVLANGPKCGVCVQAQEIQQAKDTAQYKILVVKMKAAVKRASA